MINYNNRIFKPVDNSANGESTSETVFYYKQAGNIVTAEYKGGSILYGHLIGLADSEGHIEMRYHQINEKQELMTGICESRPEILADGRIRIYETWKWTSGDFSSGYSVIEEI